MKPHEWLQILDGKNYSAHSTINKAFNALAVYFPELFDEFDGLEEVRQLNIISMSHHGAEE